MFRYSRTRRSVATSWAIPSRTAVAGPIRPRGRSGTNRNSGRQKTANQQATSGPTARTCSAASFSSPNGGGGAWTKTSNATSRHDRPPA